MRVVVMRPGAKVAVVTEAPDDAGLRSAWFRATIGVDEIDFRTLGRWAEWPRVQMVTDDLGLFRDAPLVNAAATRVYSPPWAEPTERHPVPGTVVLTGFDREGETVPVSDGVVQDLRELGIEVRDGRED